MRKCFNKGSELWEDVVSCKNNPGWGRIQNVFFACGENQGREQRTATHFSASKIVMAALPLLLNGVLPPAELMSRPDLAKPDADPAPGAATSCAAADDQSDSDEALGPRIGPAFQAAVPCALPECTLADLVATPFPSATPPRALKGGLGGGAKGARRVSHRRRPPKRRVFVPLPSG